MTKLIADLSEASLRLASLFVTNCGLKYLALKKTT